MASSFTPCPCGATEVIVSKIRPGVWVCACKGCPNHAYGNTEKEAVENWEKEMSKK
jgi:hypothetical protein